MQVADVSAAGDDDMSRAQLAVFGSDCPALVAAFDAACWRLFEDTAAARFNRLRDAACIVEAMEVEAVLAIEPVIVTARNQRLAHPLAWPELPAFAEDAVQFVGVALGALCIVGPPGSDHAGVDRLAGNRMAVDALSHQPDRLAGKSIERQCLVVADALDDSVHTAGKSGRDEPAIAARGAPADLARLNHRHVLAAALDKTEGSREPGKTSANDGDIGFMLAFQSRAVGPGRAGAGIIAVDMVDDHGMSFTSCLPMLPPFSIEMKAVGAFSIP